MCLLFAIVGVNVAGQDVTIFTQIGFIVLVGLACKNAILIVEFAKHRREEGKPVHEAAVEASRLRLRPILMTSFAFIFGVVPLVVAGGAGAEMRRSLGIAVFSGMLGVTLFGIFLTPVFFRMVQWIGWEAPHPAAARLLIDFLLSKEGQQLYQSAGRLVARSDLPQDESIKVRGAQIVPVDPAWAENFDEDSKLLKEIFSN